MVSDSRYCFCSYYAFDSHYCFDSYLGFGSESCLRPRAPGRVCVRLCVPVPVPAPHPKTLMFPIGGDWLLVSSVSVALGGVSCVFGNYGGGYPSIFNF